MQTSTILLINESGASYVNVHCMAIVKIKSSDNDVLMLLDSDEDVCHGVDISYTSYFLYKTKSSNPGLVSVDVDKIPHNSSYMKLVHHDSSSQCPLLHPFSSFSRFKIVDTLKMIKSRRRSKSDRTVIDFDSLDVRDIKYLPPSFNDDVIIILPLINVVVSSTYGHFIDDMDKMCDGYFWCTTKTINIQIGFGLSFRRFSYACHLQCTNTYCDNLYRNGCVHNCTEWIGSTLITFSVGDVVPKKSRLECKVCRSMLVCIALCHVCIIYVHSTSPGISRVCIHLGIYEHLMSNGTCRESLDMAYQCVANEVM